MQMSLCWGCSVIREGAAAPTLRICCALPPTYPVELVRKWEEQVMECLGKGSWPPSHTRVCGVGGGDQGSATPSQIEM